MCGLALLPGVARAHFHLDSPAAMYVQTAPLADPQKFPPCGADGTEMATGEVTTYQEGDTITITITETVNHPGHFRVVIAENPESLPEDPPAEGNFCETVEIQDPPVFPVLADNMLPHESGAPLIAQSFDVTLPADYTCENCTLQVIQYMTEHSQPCFYHHCATVTIEGGGAPTTTTPTDESGPITTDSDSASSGSGGSSGEAASDTNNQTSGPTSGNETSTTDDATGTGASTMPIDDPAESDSGCGCTQRPGSTHGLLALLLGLLGIAGVRRRRSV